MKNWIIGYGQIFETMQFLRDSKGKLLVFDNIWKAKKEAMLHTETETAFYLLSPNLYVTD